MDSVEAGQIAGFCVLGLVVLSGCLFLCKDVYSSWNARRATNNNLKQQYLLDIEQEWT